MEREEIAKKLKEIIEPYVQNKSALQNATEETSLLLDLEINSAHLVDIILDMEEAFDIEIDDENAEKMMTIGQALDISERLIKEQ
jgi:acyl carrier protein